MDITQVKTYFISPCKNKYTEKCMRMKQFLNQNQFRHWNLKISQLIYPSGLSQAHKEILQENLNDEPLLILEDDVEWNYEKYVQVPENTDAFYVGNSAVGNDLHPISGSTVKRIEKNLWKVKSMRGAHAIIYISKKYKSKIVDLIEKYPQEHMDVLMASCQKDYDIYALEIPLFIQKGNDVNARLSQIPLSIVHRNKFYFKIILLCGFMAFVNILMHFLIRMHVLA